MQTKRTQILHEDEPWRGAEKLDELLIGTYQYWQEGGLLAHTFGRLVDLSQVILVALFLMVPWIIDTSFLNNGGGIGDNDSVLVPMTYHFPTNLPLALVIILFGWFICWQLLLLKCFLEFLRMWRVRSFYRTGLNLQGNMTSYTWNQVVEKICLVERLSRDKQFLDELDVAMRICRLPNYYTALITRDVLSTDASRAGHTGHALFRAGGGSMFQTGGDRSFSSSMSRSPPNDRDHESGLLIDEGGTVKGSPLALTKVVEWGLHLAFFHHAFNTSTGQLNGMYRSLVSKRCNEDNTVQLSPMYNQKPLVENVQKELASRFRALAVVSVIAFPLVLLYLVANTVLVYSSQLRVNPGQILLNRDWSRTSVWTLREFNEMSMHMNCRLQKAHKSATEYISDNTRVSRWLIILSRLGVLLCGFCLTVLIISGLVWGDVALLNVSWAFDHNGTWWIAILGTIMVVLQSILSADMKQSASETESVATGGNQEGGMFLALDQRGIDDVGADGDGSFPVPSTTLPIARPNRSRSTVSGTTKSDSSSGTLPHVSQPSPSKPPSAPSIPPTPLPSSLASLMKALHIHPPSWVRGALSRQTIRNQIAALCELTIVAFFRELLAVVIAPYLFWYHLPQLSPKIVQLVMNHSVIGVPGVGDVIQWSHFWSIDRWGEGKYGAATISAYQSPDDRCRDGKMTKSLATFASSFPLWASRLPPSGAVAKTLIKLNGRGANGADQYRASHERVGGKEKGIGKDKEKEWDGGDVGDEGGGATNVNNEYGDQDSIMDSFSSVSWFKAFGGP